jgi:hypothetical protein
MDWTFATIATLYDTSEVDDSLYTYQPMDFHVELGFTEMAKLGLAVVMLLIIGVVAAVWFVARRVRRRRAGQASS